MFSFYNFLTYSTKTNETNGRMKNSPEMHERFLMKKKKKKNPVETEIQD